MRLRRRENLQLKVAHAFTLIAMVLLSILPVGCQKREKAYTTDTAVTEKYFTVPEGFAVVTRLERISADGTPLSPGRWSLETGPMRSFDLGEYLRRLLRKGGIEPVE